MAVSYDQAMTRMAKALWPPREQCGSDSFGHPNTYPMTPEQEQAILDRIDRGFERAIENTVIIDKRVKGLEQNYAEHIHRNALDIHHWVQVLLKEVDKLQRQVARLEGRVGQ